MVAGYPWQGRRIPGVQGAELHVLDEGAGETLLFVHGNPTWSFYWRHLIEAFAPKYRCVAPDHVGCGLSDKPQAYPYCLATHIENLLRVVEKLDLRDVTLVVHDWGGPIGFGAALRCPERFRRFVILNTGCFEGPLPWSIRACRLPGVGALAIRGLNGFLHAGFRMATADPERFRNGVAEGYLAPYRSWRDRVAILRFIEDIPLEPGHPSRELFFRIGEDVRKFAVSPTLILWGERDFCFVPQYRAGWVDRFPSAEVHVFENAGHWVAEDAHEKIVPLLGAFLERHAAGAA